MRSYRLHRQIIAGLLIATHLLTQTASAEISSTLFSGDRSGSQANFDLTNILSQPLIIPEDLGRVEQFHRGKKNDFVILIQDAHANYSAQRNIAAIIERLISTHGIQLVGQEGGEGRADTSLLRAFPVHEATKEVMDRYLRRGELGGPEYLAITSETVFDFVGVEKQKLYEENLKQFLNVLAVSDRGTKFIRSVLTAIQNLQTAAYSKPHREFNKLIFGYKSNKTDLHSFLRKLFTYARSVNVDIAAFPLTAKLKFAMEQERSVQSAEYRKKDLTAITRETEASRLFIEIEELSYAVRSKLASSETERKLVGLEEFLFLFGRGLRLELSRQDAARFEHLGNLLKKDKIRDFLNRASEQYRITLALGSHFQEPADDFAKAIVSFYETAKLRDDVLIERLRKEMALQNIQTAVLVAGGFHTEGIIKKLKRLGGSYVLIAPKISETSSQEDYLHLMERSGRLLRVAEHETINAPLIHVNPALRSRFLKQALPEVAALSANRRFLAEFGMSGSGNLAEVFANSLAANGIISFEDGRVTTPTALMEAARRFDRWNGATGPHTKSDERRALVNAVLNGSSKVSFPKTDGLKKSQDDKTTTQPAVAAGFGNADTILTVVKLAAVIGAAASVAAAIRSRVKLEAEIYRQFPHLSNLSFWKHPHLWMLQRADVTKLAESIARLEKLFTRGIVNAEESVRLSKIVFEMESEMGLRDESRKFKVSAGGILGELDPMVDTIVPYRYLEPSRVRPKNFQDALNEIEERVRTISKTGNLPVIRVIGKPSSGVSTFIESIIDRGTFAGIEAERTAVVDDKFLWAFELPRDHLSLEVLSEGGSSRSTGLIILDNNWSISEITFDDVPVDFEPIDVYVEASEEGRWQRLTEAETHADSGEIDHGQALMNLMHTHHHLANEIRDRYDTGSMKMDADVVVYSDELLEKIASGKIPETPIMPSGKKSSGFGAAPDDAEEVSRAEEPESISIEDFKKVLAGAVSAELDKMYPLEVEVWKGTTRWIDDQFAEVNHHLLRAGFYAIQERLYEEFDREPEEMEEVLRASDILNLDEVNGDKAFVVNLFAVGVAFAGWKVVGAKNDLKRAKAVGITQAGRERVDLRAKLRLKAKQMKREARIFKKMEIKDFSKEQGDFPGFTKTIAGLEESKRKLIEEFLQPPEIEEFDFEQVKKYLIDQHSKLLEFLWQIGIIPPEELAVPSVEFEFDIPSAIYSPLLRFVARILKPEFEHLPHTPIGQLRQARKRVLELGTQSFENKSAREAFVNWIAAEREGLIGAFSALSGLGMNVIAPGGIRIAIDLKLNPGVSDLEDAISDILNSELPENLVESIQKKAGEFGFTVKSFKTEDGEAHNGTPTIPKLFLELDPPFISYEKPAHVSIHPDTPAKVSLVHGLAISARIQDRQFHYVDRAIDRGRIAKEGEDIVIYRYPEQGKEINVRRLKVGEFESGPVEGSPFYVTRTDENSVVIHSAIEKGIGVRPVLNPKKNMPVWEGFREVRYERRSSGGYSGFSFFSTDRRFVTSDGLFVLKQDAEEPDLILLETVDDQHIVTQYRDQTGFILDDTFRSYESGQLTKTIRYDVATRKLKIETSHPIIHIAEKIRILPPGRKTKKTVQLEIKPLAWEGFRFVDLKERRALLNNSSVKWDDRVIDSRFETEDGLITLWRNGMRENNVLVTADGQYIFGKLIFKDERKFPGPANDKAFHGIRAENPAFENPAFKGRLGLTGDFVHLMRYDSRGKVLTILSRGLESSDEMYETTVLVTKEGVIVPVKIVLKSYWAEGEEGAKQEARESGFGADSKKQKSLSAMEVIRSIPGRAWASIVSLAARLMPELLRWVELQFKVRKVRSLTLKLELAEQYGQMEAVSWAPYAYSKLERRTLSAVPMLIQNLRDRSEIFERATQEVPSGSQQIAEWRQETERMAGDIVKILEEAKEYYGKNPPSASDRDFQANVIALTLLLSQGSDDFSKVTLLSRDILDLYRKANANIGLLDDADEWSAQDDIQSYFSARFAHLDPAIIGKTTLLFGLLAPFDLTIGAQQFLKMWIYDALERDSSSFDIKEKLTQTIVPALRMLEALAGDFPDMGTEIDIFRLEEGEETDESLSGKEDLSNFFMDVLAPHGVEDSAFSREEGILGVRALPSAFPVAFLNLLLHLRLGLLNKQSVYSTGIEGALGQEAFFILVLSFFTFTQGVARTYELETDPSAQFTDAIHFANAHESYAETAADPLTGRVRKDQTLFRDKTFLWIDAFFNSLAKKELALVADRNAEELTPDFLMARTLHEDLELKAFLALFAFESLKTQGVKGERQRTYEWAKGEIESFLRGLDDRKGHSVFTREEVDILAGKYPAGFYFPRGGALHSKLSESRVRPILLKLQKHLKSSDADFKAFHRLIENTVRALKSSYFKDRPLAKRAFEEASLGPESLHRALPTEGKLIAMLRSDIPFDSLEEVIQILGAIGGPRAVDALKSFAREHAESAYAAHDALQKLGARLERETETQGAAGFGARGNEGAEDDMEEIESPSSPESRDFTRALSVYDDPDAVMLDLLDVIQRIRRPIHITLIPETPEQRETLLNYGFSENAETQQNARNDIVKLFESGQVFEVETLDSSRRYHIGGWEKDEGGQKDKRRDFYITLPRSADFTKVMSGKGAAFLNNPKIPVKGQRDSLALASVLSEFVISGLPLQILASSDRATLLEKLVGRGFEKYERKIVTEEDLHPASPQRGLPRITEGAGEEGRPAAHGPGKSASARWRKKAGHAARTFEVPPDLDLPYLNGIFSKISRRTYVVPKVVFEAFAEVFGGFSLRHEDLRQMEPEVFDRFLESVRKKAQEGHDERAVEVFQFLSDEKNASGFRTDFRTLSQSVDGILLWPEDQLFASPEAVLGHLAMAAWAEVFLDLTASEEHVLLWLDHLLDAHFPRLSAYLKEKISVVDFIHWLTIMFPFEEMPPEIFVEFDRFFREVREEASHPTERFGQPEDLIQAIADLEHADTMAGFTEWLKRKKGSSMLVLGIEILLKRLRPMAMKHFDAIRRHYLRTYAGEIDRRFGQAWFLKEIEQRQKQADELADRWFGFLHGGKERHLEKSGASVEIVPPVSVLMRDHGTMVSWSMSFAQFPPIDVNALFEMMPPVAEGDLDRALRGEDTIILIQDSEGVRKKLDLKSVDWFASEHHLTVRVGRWKYQILDGEIHVMDKKDTVLVTSRDEGLRAFLLLKIQAALGIVLKKYAGASGSIDTRVPIRLRAGLIQYHVYFAPDAITVFMGRNNGAVIRRDGSIQAVVKNAMGPAPEALKEQVISHSRMALTLARSFLAGDQEPVDRIVPLGEVLGDQSLLKTQDRGFGVGNNVPSALVKARLGNLGDLKKELGIRKFWNKRGTRSSGFGAGRLPAHQPVVFILSGDDLATRERVWKEIQSGRYAEDFLPVFNLRTPLVLARIYQARREHKALAVIAYEQGKVDYIKKQFARAGEKVSVTFHKNDLEHPLDIEELISRMLLKQEEQHVMYQPDNEFTRAERKALAFMMRKLADTAANPEAFLARVKKGQEILNGEEAGDIKLNYPSAGPSGFKLTAQQAIIKFLREGGKVTPQNLEQVIRLFYLIPRIKYLQDRFRSLPGMDGFNIEADGLGASLILEGDDLDDLFFALSAADTELLNRNFRDWAASLPSTIPVDQHAARGVEPVKPAAWSKLVFQSWGGSNSRPGMYNGAKLPSNAKFWALPGGGIIVNTAETDAFDFSFQLRRLLGLDYDLESGEEPGAMTGFGAKTSDESGRRHVQARRNALLNILNGLTTPVSRHALTELLNQQPGFQDVSLAAVASDTTSDHSLRDHLMLRIRNYTKGVSGFGTGNTIQEKIILRAVRNEVSRASSVRLERLAGFKTVVLGSRNDLDELERRLWKYAPEVRAKVLNAVESVIAGWAVTEEEANQIWNRLAALFPNATRREQIFVRENRSALIRLRDGTDAVLLGQKTDYLLNAVGNIRVLEMMQENQYRFVHLIGAALEAAKLRQHIFASAA